MKTNQILQGDVIDIIKRLIAGSINCIITSPPYFGLRFYDLPPTHWPEVSYAPMAGLPEITIPPIACCLGLEDSIEAYVGHMVLVFRGLWRLLRDDGVAWLNLGDSYAGNSNKTGEGEKRNLKTEKFHGGNAHLEQRRVAGNHGLSPKNLIGIPWRVAFALQADGWYLRSDVIWAKKNGLPESCRDRPTKAHEYVFLLAKSGKYWYDQEAIREPQVTRSLGEAIKRCGKGGGQYDKWEDKYGYRGKGGLSSDTINYNPNGRNKRTVWELATKSFKKAHFAVMPEALVEPCLLAGCPAQVCAKCGEPWVRVVEKGEPYRIGGNAGNSQSSAIGPMDRNGKGQWDKDHIILSSSTKTIGHTPTCQCNGHFEEQTIPDYYDWEETAEAKKKVVRVYVPDISLDAHATHPGIVLDPFFGAGTVGVVAKKFKRDFIGIDLNSEYVTLAQERINATQPALFAR